MNAIALDIETRLRNELAESVRAKTRALEEGLGTLTRITELLIGTLRADGKILVCGNGGSAADSQHIAAELVSRFRRERQALAAIALTVDTSILTAIGNDYGFESVFSRQVEALGRPGDALLAISTSGNSPNVLRAVDAARRLRMVTVGFTGEDGGKLKDGVDVCFRAPSNSTPRIQEVHIAAGHSICEVIEAVLANA